MSWIHNHEKIICARLAARLGDLIGMTIMKGVVFGDNGSYIHGLYLHEPADFSQILRRRLKEGYTDPQARAAATDVWLAQAGQPACPPGLLSSPNSILAIEYHKALLSLCQP